MNWVAWLLALAWPIAKKILVALGIGFVTYQGFTVIANQLKAEIIGAWGQIGQSTIQILSLAGVNTALGIVLSAIAARAALAAVGKLQKLA